MDLKNYIPKGELTGFPIEIIEKMLYYQVKQGNLENVIVFETYPDVSYLKKGFCWEATPERSNFWHDVIINKNFETFFKRYPKKSLYPKLMMVSDEPFTLINKGKPRVVFMEKCGKFIAWSDATTLEAAEKIINIKGWAYAKDIESESESEFIEVTLEDIAKQMNIPVEKLRIKK